VSSTPASAAVQAGVVMFSSTCVALFDDLPMVNGLGRGGALTA
jgi:hypothetical protein